MLTESLISLFVFLYFEDYDSSHPLTSSLSEQLTLPWDGCSGKQIYSFSILYPFVHFAPMCSRSFAPCFKISLWGTLDPSCAYGEDQAGRNEENYGFAFPSILTSTVVSQHQKQCIVSHNRCSRYISHKVRKARREYESANPFWSLFCLWNYKTILHLQKACTEK